MNNLPAKNVSRDQRQIPDKLFYKIGEVSRIAGVEPYVLRYWETEFSFLKPRKNKSGQRVYTRKDLELVLHIRTLLYTERYTIEGVRKKYGEPVIKPPISPEPHQSSQEVLEKVKKRLRSILNQIS